MIVKWLNPSEEYCSKCGKDFKESGYIYATDDESTKCYEMYCKKCAKKICDKRGIKLPKEIK